MGGAKELLASSGTVSYWTSLEKWATVQYFYTKGYVPTKDGWMNDCYELGNVADDNNIEECKTLFDKIQDYRDEALIDNDFFKRKTTENKNLKRNCTKFCVSLCKEPQEPGKQREIRIEEKRLSEGSLLIRKKHWDRIERKLEQLMNEKTPQVTHVDPQIKIENFFEHSDGAMFIIHCALTLAIFLSGIGCYLLIARNIELTQAVKQGFTVLGSSNVSAFGWVCFCLFWALIIVYFHKEFIHDIKVAGSSLGIMCKGCKTEGENIETVFNPPDWKGNQDYVDFKVKTETFVPEKSKDIE